MNKKITKKNFTGINVQLAEIFSKMAACYRYLGGGERFRAQAYENAAKVLTNMKEPVDAYGDDIKALDKLKAVGESIAKKILEYEHTGKVAGYEKLKKNIPMQLLDLMNTEGIGPATVRQLHDELQINTLDELTAAIEQGKLNNLKGFASKKIENLKNALKRGKTEKRFPLKLVQPIADEVLAKIRKIPSVMNAEIAGSIRRKNVTIGDIDIVIIAEKKAQAGIIRKFIQFPEIAEVISAGTTKASVLLHQRHIQLDIRIVEPSSYGAAIFYFTGSKEHNLQLRVLAKQKGWKMNEYGVFDVKTGRKLAGETEAGIYALFGYPYIPPEKRLGLAELEK